MFKFDPYTVTLGPPAWDATATTRVRWVDDAEAQTPRWDLEHRDPNTLVAYNHTTDTDTLTLQADDTVRVANLRVTGDVVAPVHFAGAHTQLSGFDANNDHWLHAGDTKTADQILRIERLAAGDYQLHISEGDQVGRVLTSTDDALDADTLDGLDSTAFVRRNGSTALTGALDAGGHALTNTTAVSSGGGLTLTADADQTGTGTLDLAVGATTGLTVTQAGDVDAAGALTQQGNAVLTTASDIGIDVENTAGTPLVESVNAITAGTDLSFADDGDDTATLTFTGDVAPASAAVGDTHTASGDGTTTVFSLPHSLGAVPDAASVDAASAAASTDFRITNKTSSAVEITYATAPPTGPDNLAWEITTTASGLTATTVSDDGATVGVNPDDINAGAGLTAADDGDNTVTVATDATVGHLDTAETASAAWQFDAGVTVGADATLGLTNASGTTQFGFHYDATADQQVWADVANASRVATVDRAQVVDFTTRPTVGGTQLATVDDTSGGGGGATNAVSVTASGDDATTTFAFAHGLGETPAGAFVQPTSKAAMADFRVTNKTATDVVIQYHRPPPTGTDNLRYDVLTHA